MVHLTTMLVMGTLYQGFSASMPKTEYLKVIEIWLLCGLAVQFVAFVVETIVRLLSIDDKEGDPVNAQIKRIFAQDQIEMAAIDEREKNALPETKKTIAIRKKIKLILQYLSQVMISLVTLILIVSYACLAYAYY